jgi:zinc protease
MEDVMKTDSRYSVRLPAVFFCVIVLVMAAGTGLAKSPYFDWTYDPIDFNPPVPERFVFDNGMVVHFLPDDRLPVVTFAAIVRTGEIYVPADKAGLAGIAGRTLTTGGTETRSPEEFEAQVDNLGIRLNGSIGDESGELSMNCLSKDVDTAVALFAELLCKPAFDSARFQLAIDDALEQWRRRNDSPRSIISREFAKLLYGNHPYGRFPDKTTLEELTRDDVVAFYRRYFTPGNTILAVSGDLTREQLDELLYHHFSSWNTKGEKLPEVPVVSDSARTGVFQIAKDINQTNIRFGHLGIDRKNPDRHALRVMNYILGSGGFTSRMVGRVRSDSGWAYSVGTRMTTANQPGMFYAACQTNSENTTKTLSLMEWVIEDFLKNGITKDELATAKESILNSDVFRYVTPSQIVEQYAWLEYYGYPPDQMTKDVEAIKTITKRQVEEVARRYLHPDKFTILAVGPIDEFDDSLATFGNVETIKLEE